MKAAVLEAFGSPLLIKDLPDPVIGTGEVVVDMFVAGIVNYSNEVFSGERRYLIEPPIVPGSSGIGRVRAVGPDATKLKIDDWVFCDSTVRSRDDVINPDIVLQGMSAGNAEGALQLQRYFHNGSFAEQMLTPTENVFKLDDFDPADAVEWIGMGTALVPYGGLLSIDFKAGETIVVNGATGQFGSAAVSVALAMGASSVVATGRNESVLRRVASKLGPRVRPVVMSGSEDADRAAILEAAGGPLDCMIDFLPPEASPVQVHTAMFCIRPNGRISLMGGVGMLGDGNLSLPYRWIMRNNITIRGQWMYNRDAVPRMMGLVRGGLIDLSFGEVVTFPLDDVNAAVDHAAQNAGPFSRTLLRLTPE